MAAFHLIKTYVGAQKKWKKIVHKSKFMFENINSHIHVHEYIFTAFINNSKRS